MKRKLLAKTANILEQSYDGTERVNTIILEVWSIKTYILTTADKNYNSL